MTGGPPELIAIDHDDHYAEHVGRTAGGKGHNHSDCPAAAPYRGRLARIPQGGIVGR